MATAKDQITKVLDAQPDDSSYEELLRELAFHRMVEQGLADSQNNRTVSNKDMEHRIASWQK